MELIINEMQFIRNIISVFLAFHPGLSRLLPVLLNNNTGVRNFMETREPLDKPKLHVFSLNLARARLLVLLKLKNAYSLTRRVTKLFFSLSYMHFFSCSYSNWSLYCFITGSWIPSVIHVLTKRKKLHIYPQSLIKTFTSSMALTIKKSCTMYMFASTHVEFSQERQQTSRISNIIYCVWLKPSMRIKFLLSSKPSLNNHSAPGVEMIV